MLKILTGDTNIWSEAQGTNVRSITPQATKFTLVVLCLAAVALLAVGCESEKTRYEKDIAAWEECMSSETEITDAHGTTISDKYGPLFERQPNYVYHSYGPFIKDITYERDHDRKGIRVRVFKKVDQSTLPEEDRIPDCLEGVPVQIVEGTWESTTG